MGLFLLLGVKILSETSFISIVINGICRVPFVCPQLSVEPWGLQSISEVISVPT